MESLIFVLLHFREEPDFPESSDPIDPFHWPLRKYDGSIIPVITASFVSKCALERQFHGSYESRNLEIFNNYSLENDLEILKTAIKVVSYIAL